MSVLAQFGLVEFYVTCNPPLLPKGVDNIISRIKAELGPKVDEILYEPEIPWFKIRSPIESRSDIEKWIRDALVNIGEEDVAPCEFGVDDQGPEDVDVDPESQRVLPFVHYVAENVIHPSVFDRHRFPDFLGGQYREVWQLPADDVEALIESSKGKWFTSYVPSSMDNIGSSIESEVTWDAEQTVLYVGSIHSMAKVQEGIRKLGSIIDTIRLLSELRWSHLLVVYAPGQVRVGFVWLMHLDLAAKTYNFNLQPSSDPRRGATPRLAREKSPGEDQWTMVMTRYQSAQASSSPQKRPDAFSRCVYRPKEAWVKIAPVSLVKKEVPQPPVGDELVDKWLLGMGQVRPKVTTAAPARDRKASAPARDSHSVPRRIMDSVISPMKGIAEFLRAVPGKVTLKLQLGRLWFNGLAGHTVHSDGPGVSGEVWRVEELQGQLNASLPHASFQSILTASREDVKRLVDIRAPNAPRWQDPEIVITYEFLCRLHNSKFKVVVDADTFKHEVIGLAQEIAGVNIHCPEHAWDMRITASHAQSSFDTSYWQVAKILTSSLTIKPEGGEVTLEVAARPQELLAVIDSVEIRHVARYKSRATNGRLLTITMTRPIAHCNANNVQQQPGFRGRTHSASHQSSLGEYFEAALSSWRADEMFEENLSMEFGQRTKWTKDDFEAEGVFGDMCRPALIMVPQMDSIGLANRNKNPSPLEAEPNQTQGVRYEF